MIACPGVLTASRRRSGRLRPQGEEAALGGTLCSVWPPPGPRGTLLHGTVRGDPPEGAHGFSCWVLSWPRSPACSCRLKMWAGKHLSSQALLRAMLPQGQAAGTQDRKSPPPWVWGEGRGPRAGPPFPGPPLPLTAEGLAVKQLPNAGASGTLPVGWAGVCPCRRWGPVDGEGSGLEKGVTLKSCERWSSSSSSCAAERGQTQRRAEL